MAIPTSLFDTNALEVLVHQTWSGFSTAYLLMSMAECHKAAFVLCRTIGAVNYHIREEYEPEFNSLLHSHLDLHYEIWLAVRAELERRNSYAPNLYGGQ